MAAPRRARRARGEPASPDPGARVVGNLRGAPVSEAFLRFAPIDDIPALRGCALLIIDGLGIEPMKRQETWPVLHAGNPPLLTRTIPVTTNKSVRVDRTVRRLQGARGSWTDTS